jgi:hypothetical protein
MECVSFSLNRAMYGVIGWLEIADWTTIPSGYAVIE